MSIGKKTFVLMMILVLILVVACDREPSPNRMIDRSSEDTSSGSSDESFPTPEDTENLGSALLVYSYLIENPNVEVKINANVPVTIERDPENEGKYIVNGFNSVSATIKTAGGSGGPECWVHCDFQPILYATGTLTQDFTKGCSINIKFEPDFSDANPSKYGSCPEVLINNYPCMSVIMSFADEHTYVFTKEVPYDIPDPNPGRDRRAEIKNVNMPGSLMGFCKWGD